MSRQDKATTERHTKMLREMVKQGDNKVCADCKRHDPRWASWNIGVFICIRCSGIHRSMGTHISKVKSVDLDTWTPEQMQSIQKWGNHRANLYWEAHLKPGHVPPDHKVESFIRSKYDSRRWAMEGPPPSDPSILENSVKEEDLPPVVEIPASVAMPPPSTITSPTSSTYTPPTLTKASAAPPVLSTRPPHFRTTSASTSQTQAQRTATSAPTKPSTPKPQAKPTPPPPKANTIQEDLFNIDMRPPGLPSSTSPAPRDVNKDSILSLYSGAAPASTTAPAVQQAFTGFGQTSANANAGVWGSSTGWGTSNNSRLTTLPTAASTTAAAPASLTSSMASMNLWGAPTITAAQQSTQPQPQSTNMTSNFFETSNVWGGSGTSSTGGFGGIGNVSGGLSGLSGSGAGIWGGANSITTTTAEALGAAQQKKDDPFGDLWK